MQLQALEIAIIHLVGDRHVQRGDPPIPRVAVATLSDHHIPTITIAPLQITPGRGPRLGRHHDLEKLVTDGQQRILQPEHANPRIDITNLERKNMRQLVDHRREFTRNQANLA